MKLPPAPVAKRPLVFVMMALAVAAGASDGARAGQKPRVMVMTDIGGDPDDWRIDIPMRIAYQVVETRDDADVALFEFVPRDTAAADA